MRHRLFFLVLALLFFVSVFNIAMPEKASAQEEYWSVSAANWMQYWFFSEERSQGFIPAKTDSLDNRLIVDFNLGDFYTGMWLDVLQIENLDNSHERMSQRYFGWRDRGLTVHAGNFYQAFDRGLTLNVFLDDIIDFDNNLDGVKVSGVYDRFDFDAFSARGNDSFTGERSYILRGTRASVRPISPLSIGFSYVRFKEADIFQFGRTKNSNITGINSGISYGPFDLYGEYAEKIVKEDTVFNQPHGYGTYLTGSAAFDKISFYGEYKNMINLLYPNAQNPFNSPPPLSHQGRTLSSRANVNGEEGYQIGTLISPTYDLNFEVAYSEVYERGKPFGVVRGRYYHSERYVGLRNQINDNIVVNYSWDFIKYTLEDEIENYFDTYYYLGNASTVSMTAYTRKFMLDDIDSYHEDFLIVGYGQSNRFQLNLGGSKSSEEGGFDKNKLAYAELIVKFDSHELVIFHGGERGGLICSSGICQERPTFEGTRVVLFSRF